MKVNKEEMLGMMVALELYVKRDHEADWREWERWVKQIRDSVSTIRGVHTEMFVPEIHYRVPHVRIRWEENVVRLTVRDVIKQLREGDPSIEVRPNTNEGLELGVWLLQPGETEIVARQVRRVLGG